MSQLGQITSLLSSGVTSLTGDSGGALTGALKIKGGNNITTAAAGTDITVNVSGTTNHAIQLGNAGGSLSSLAVGATGTVLTGVTGADPAFSASPTVTTIYAGTFDTNVAAAAVTLAGTTLSADGTDVDININITAKGAGKVIIDDLQLTTDLAVTEGGTGVSTLTDHGLLVGSGTAAIDALSVGATGTILTGVSGADPTWTTATYPSTVTKGDVLVASANNVVGVVNDVVNAGYVLTANAAAAPTFQALPSSVTFASDAETIAGTVTNKAVAPSNLKAKLGTQTIHALPIGASDSAALGWLAVGATNEIIIGNTGADASWSSSPTVTTMKATTFDTNIAAAKLQMAGTTITATGSDANVGLTITPKGSGALTLTTGDVSVTSGNLKLPTTTSTVGQIQINSTRVFHTYGTQNLFVGEGAGNFTLTTAQATGNTAFGYGALAALTGTGVNKGSSNNAQGVGALAACTDGYDNICIGNIAAYQGTTLNGNVVIGNRAARNLLTGNFNVIVGGTWWGAATEAAGSNYTSSESSNILIHNKGTVGESNKIRIGTYGTGDRQQDTAYIAGIVHASNGLVSDAGNISAPAGSVSANTTVTAGTDLVSTAGVLKLPTTTSTVGQIRINNVRVFHTYAASGTNTFVGQESGNFTMTNTGANTGLGTYTLQSLTSGSGGNSAFGYGSLQACTSGYNNVAFGNSCLYNLTQGHHNTSVGPYPTAYYLTTGSFNVTIGTTGLQNGGSGSYWGAGKNLTSNETSNFLIAALGVTGESNRLEIGYGSGTGSAQINKAFIHGIYGRTPVGTLNIALIDSNGQLGSTATLSQSYLTNGLTWNNSTSTPITAAVNNEYTINTASGLTTINLPAAFAVNDRIKIVGSGVDGWTLVASSGDTIQMGSTPTSSGGSISSTVRYDCVEIVCIVANTTWVVSSSQGTLTVA